MKNSTIKTSAPLVFFGNEQLSSGYRPTDAPVLEALINNGYEIAALVIHAKPSTSRKSHTPSVITVAQKHNIPVYYPHRPSEITDTLEQIKPQAAVLVAYGRIIPQSIIDIFPRGIINIHPSLLPLYRGSTPIEQAILDGVDTTGVSLMKLSKEMDTGDVYDQEQITLTPAINKLSLTRQLHEKGRDMLIKNLPAILNGTNSGHPQDHSQATFTPQITKEDGTIDFTTETAEAIDRKIRAYAGWPQTKAVISTPKNQHFSIIINEATLTTRQLAPGELHVQKNELLVGTKSSSISLLNVTIPGKKPMDIAAFINGYMR